MSYTTNLNTYQQLNLLENKSSLSVFLIEKINNKLKLILKQYNIEELNSDYFKIIQDEIFANRMLKHANLLKFSECFINCDKLWCFMPYYSFGTLTDMISHYYPKGIPKFIGVKILYDIDKALVYLHTRNLIHRNVCSDNIYVSSRGMAHLAGLGYVISMYSCTPGKREQKIYNFPKYSNEKLVLSGSPEFLAQDLGGYDQKTDIYSLGLVACHMMNGEVPYKNIDNTQLLLEKISGNLPPILRPSEKLKSDTQVKQPPKILGSKYTNIMIAHQFQNQSIPITSTNEINTHDSHQSAFDNNQNKITRRKPLSIDDLEDLLRCNNQIGSPPGTPNIYATITPNPASHNSAEISADLASQSRRKFSHESSIGSSGLGSGTAGAGGLVIRRAVIPFKEDILLKNSLPVFPATTMALKEEEGGGRDGSGGFRYLNQPFDLSALPSIGFHKSILQRLITESETFPEEQRVANDGVIECYEPISKSADFNTAIPLEYGNMTTTTASTLDNTPIIDTSKAITKSRYSSSNDVKEVTNEHPPDSSKQKQLILQIPELQTQQQPSNITLQSTHQDYPLSPSTSSVPRSDPRPLLKYPSGAFIPNHPSLPSPNNTHTFPKKKRKLRFFHVTKITNGASSSSPDFGFYSTTKPALEPFDETTQITAKPVLEGREKIEAVSRPAITKLTRNLFSRFPFSIRSKNSVVKRRRYRSLFIPFTNLKPGGQPTTPESSDLQYPSYKNLKKYSLDSSAMQPTTSTQIKDVTIAAHNGHSSQSTVHDNLIISPDQFSNQSYHSNDYNDNNSISSQDKSSSNKATPESPSYAQYQSLPFNRQHKQQHHHRRRSTFVNFFISTSHILGNLEYKKVVDLQSFAQICLKFDPEERPSSEAILSFPLFKKVHKFRPETLSDAISLRLPLAKKSSTSITAEGTLIERSKSPALDSWKF